MTISSKQVDASLDSLSRATTKLLSDSYATTSNPIEQRGSMLSWFLVNSAICHPSEWPLETLTKYVSIARLELDKNCLARGALCFRIEET